MILSTAAPAKIPTLQPIPGPYSTYPGGKGAPGVYQTIINHTPLHTRYFEPFVGGGEIFRRKRLAYWSFIGDIDRTVCEQWDQVLQANPGIKEQTAIYCQPWQDQIVKAIKDSHAFIFLDPPYLGAVRSSQKAMYRHEMMMPGQHIRLLEFITQKSVAAHIMICGYPSDLYDTYLDKWHRLEYQGWSHNGPKTECIWMNYDIDTYKLHDYRYWGADKRKREDVRAKVKRWVKGLERMPVREREAIVQAIRDAY